MDTVLFSTQVGYRILFIVPKFDVIPQLSTNIEEASWRYIFNIDVKIFFLSLNYDFNEDF